MADPEQLRLLTEEGVIAWNSWPRWRLNLVPDTSDPLT
jgi:hypothetical protein